MKYCFHGGCIHSQSGAHGAYTVTEIIEKRNLLKRKHHVVTVCMSNFWEGNVLSRLSLCHFVCSRWGGGSIWLHMDLFTLVYFTWGPPCPPGPVPHCPAYHMDLFKLLALGPVGKRAVVLRLKGLLVFQYVQTSKDTIFLETSADITMGSGLQWKF